MNFCSGHRLANFHALFVYSTKHFLTTIIFQACARCFRPLCVSLRQKLLVPRAITSAKKRNDVMQKPVGPLTSPVGAASLLVEEGAVRSLNSLFLQLDQGLAKLFCKGQIISILGIAGHMVSAIQFCSHRAEYINK